MIDRLRTYVRVDHRTRRRNDLWSATISVGLYMTCLILGVGEQIAVKISIGLLVVAVIGTTVRYCLRPTPTEEKVKAVGRLSKRKFPHLIWQLPVVILAFLGNVATPPLEAGIVDARLRWAAHGEPSQDKIEKAIQIFNEAKANNVHVSPNVITQVGQKILGSAIRTPHLQQTAVEAANQFATYRSSLQALPLKVIHIRTLTGTPTDPKGPSISVDVGCATAMNGAEGKTGNIFGFAGLTVGNCSDVVISPAKPEVIRLDNLDSKNVTFVNFTLIYNGGNLKLENVRFINCTFQISVAYAGNQNVLQLLTAALTGQPIHLELTA